MLFFPLMFFAGLWIPRAQMPASLRRSATSPRWAPAVRAVQAAMRGAWPPAAALVVLAGYAVVFSVAAARFFRWE